MVVYKENSYKITKCVPTYPVTYNLWFRVQETDGSYFESFTALSWRQENRRLAALRLAEGRAERPPPVAQDLGLPSVSAQLSHKDHEHLYTEVLYL